MEKFDPEKFMEFIKIMAKALEDDAKKEASAVEGKEKEDGQCSENKNWRVRWNP